MSSTYCVGFIHIGRVTVSQVVLFKYSSRNLQLNFARTHEAFEALIP